MMIMKKSIDRLYILENPFLIIMNNNQTKGKCCQCIKQFMIIFAFLSLFFTIYSLDQSLITIGSLNTNITALNNQDTAPLTCLQICTVDYGQAYGQNYCCVDSTIITTCKTKQECKLQVLSHYQNQLNTQYLYLLFQSGIALVIVVLFAVYCVRKRLQKARRARQAQQNQTEGQNIHAPLFNYVGSLYIRREFEPASLQSSFLFQQQQHVCSICLQNLLEAKAIRLNCNHIFHSECIKQWMQSKNTCPVCRTRN